MKNIMIILAFVIIGHSLIGCKKTSNTVYLYQEGKSLAAMDITTEGSNTVIMKCTMYNPNGELLSFVGKDNACTVFDVDNWQCPGDCSMSNGNYKKAGVKEQGASKTVSMLEFYYKMIMKRGLLDTIKFSWNFN